MAKRRKYGDAWKDVQIDAEQNDAVFDRFFKRTQQQQPDVPMGRDDTIPPAEKGADLSTPQRKLSSTESPRPAKRTRQNASVQPITPTLPNISSGTDTTARIDRIKQQYRLSKGEAAVLKCLLEKATENGSFDCHAKIPQLAETCEMTHRGCQFALRNLETRGFVTRLKDYDPGDRLGIQFRISLPTA
jgi:hypothetical protein